MATFYKRILGNVYGGQKAIIDIRKKYISNKNRHAWTLKNSSLYSSDTGDWQKAENEGWKKLSDFLKVSNWIKGTESISHLI